eukprot:gene5723-11565_t
MSSDSKNPNAKGHSKLRLFYDSCIRKKHTLQSEREAKNFFDAIFAFDNKLDLVYNLSDNALHGKDVLRIALSLSCSDSNNINSTVIKFLDYIGDNTLNIGSTKKCVSDLYLIAYHTPGLLNIIENLLESREIKDPLVIAWFLVSICLSEATCRENLQILRISELLKINGTSVPQLDTLLCSRKFEEGKMGEVSLEYLRSMQPQHDNDFLDYRRVSIVPTATEINSRISVCGIAPTWRSLADSDHENEASLLDRQFRLLREDMVAPMREEIQKELRVVKNDRKRMYDKPCAIKASLDPSPCVLIRVAMPIAIQKRVKNMKKNEKENFFENAGHRILSRDSLVAFITNNQVVNIGVIVRRSFKDNEFIKEDGYFVVGVSFFGESFLNALSMIGKQEVSLMPMADVLFQASTSYFSYEPVLKCIQQMIQIPFSEEIVRGQNPLPIQTTDSTSTSSNGNGVSEGEQGSGSESAQTQTQTQGFHLPDDIRLQLTNDPSQLRAVEMSLSQRVSLIQGPPGTGKTFVGVQIARSLIANNCHRILCLCYTNHALDSFLEELIAVGVPKKRIVRIGKSPKISEELQDCCLTNTSETQFDRQQRYRYAMLKKEEERLQDRFKSIENDVLNSSDWGASSWPMVSDYLQYAGTDQLFTIYQALAAVTSTYNPSNDSYQSVGRRGRTMAPDYYWRRWCKGQSKEDNSNQGWRTNRSAPGHEEVHPIWLMSLAERVTMIKSWCDESKQPLLDEMANTMRQYETAKRTLDELRNETKLSYLQNAYVIGCTTTSAAKNKSLLADVQLNAIMIEEAAEILEAHVLTTLTPSVKALIMIGDHKQLRPKLEHFDLRKDSGKGVDFDVSLFERLANQEGDFPVSRLNIQHRMRPEISSIVRNTTYSDLEDHPNVLNREHIKGLDSDFLWIDHPHEERNDEDKVELGSSSKFNLYEVGMVVEIVRYLLLQGYQPCDLVVLTPYLGQLVQIRSALEKASLAVDLGDLDQGDLTKLTEGDAESSTTPPQTEEVESSQSQSQSLTRSGKAKKLSVRVATIDNYQGEESKIVIASLVRSNIERDVGFLSGPERVNVLFSRARDGMIIVGNMTTFNEAKSAKARRLWSGIITQLTGTNRICEGLPAKCACHGNKPSAMLNTVEAFRLHVPDGGCNEKCTVILPHCPHDHICPKKCHPDALEPNGHDNVKCIEILMEKCPNNHDVERICGEREQKPCQEHVLEQCPNGHHYNRFCCLPAAKQCKICQRLEAEAATGRRKEAELLKRQEEELAQAELRRIQAESLLVSEQNETAISNSIRRVKMEEVLALEQAKRLKMEREAVSAAIAIATATASAVTKSGSSPTISTSSSVHKAGPKQTSSSSNSNTNNINANVTKETETETETALGKRTRKAGRDVKKAVNNDKDKDKGMDKVKVKDNVNVDVDVNLSPKDSGNVHSVSKEQSSSGSNRPSLDREHNMSPPSPSTPASASALIPIPVPVPVHPSKINMVESPVPPPLPPMMETGTEIEVEMETEKPVKDPDNSKIIGVANETNVLLSSSSLPSDEDSYDIIDESECGPYANDNPDDEESDMSSTTSENENENENGNNDDNDDDKDIDDDGNGSDTNEIPLESDELIQKRIVTESLPSIFQSADKQDWIRCYDVTQAGLNKLSNSVTQVTNYSLEVILLLVSLHLGESVSEIENKLDKFWVQHITNNRNDVTAEIILHYVLAICKSKTDLIRTASNHADSFLKLLNTHNDNDNDNDIDITTIIPSIWQSDADRIIKTSSSSNNTSTAAAASTMKSKSKSSMSMSASQKWERAKTDFASSSSSSLSETKSPFSSFYTSSSSNNTNEATTTATAEAASSSPSPSIDTLMKLTGLESVKLVFINEYHRINLSKEQGLTSGASSYNTRCDGNPGTGKTTVARLYGSFLEEVGILPKDSIVEETSGSALISGGVGALKKILEKIKAAKGGVVFVDEAYQLNPSQSQGGREVLDFILVHAERLQGEYGSLVWIFAGYNKHMDKLFEHNPGLPSRFPIKFTFEDYSDDELLDIFNGILKNGGETVGKGGPPAPKKDLKPKPTRTNRSINMSPSGLNYANRYGGYNSPFGPQSSQDMERSDKWGNIWSFEQAINSWIDAYDNTTGYGPADVGTTRNPLISRTTGIAWIYNDYTKIWSNRDNPSQISKAYPGKPVIEEKPKKKSVSFTVSDAKWARIAIRRLGRLRGTVGFGNARAVRILFDLCRRRQAERITSAKAIGQRPDIYEFVRDDLLGPKADEVALSKCSAWKELQAMEGLKEVKQSVRDLLDLVIENAQREEDEVPLFEVTLNRIFLGNPGTGKTTVAKIYARILTDLGLLSKGEVIMKNPSDFIGSVLGSSEVQTRAILVLAEGSVLVIDEAYGLSPSFGGSNVGGSQDPYKTAVIDTLVEQVQGVSGEDRAVILLGYRKEMEAMLRGCNPGMSRRFQLEYAFEFHDYDDAALIRILKARCDKDKIHISIPTAVFAVKQLARARAQPNFGNAGAVNNLLSHAKLRMQSRMKNQNNLQSTQRKDELLPDDFTRDGDDISSDESDLFEGLVGCDGVIEKLREYKNTIALAQEQGRNPKDFIEFNFVFCGAPGTGKDLTE